MLDEPTHRGILGVDIERFNRPEWTDPIRADLRTRLHDLVDRALAGAGITAAQTDRLDAGDGLLLLVAGQVSTARLLDPLAAGLASGLAEENRQVAWSARMRLRVVVHAGEVLADAHGHTGASLNHAARLLEAETTRSILAGSPEASVVLVVSDEVYQGVVRHAYRGIDPDGWQPVRIHAKETTTRAWAHLPGVRPQPDLPALLAAPRIGPASLPIPRELPNPPADFTGRDRELATLEGLLSIGEAGGSGRTVVISAIDGMGGIGKSALALWTAKRRTDAGAFPDGQLYVNLHGATPGLAPLAPLDALGRMLRSLGLEPAAIPGEVEEAAARFRSLAADRRLLVLLDNAATAQQVRPLLPASPTCAVLVTSRQSLATLDGVRLVHLDVLPAGQAVELLARIAGRERVAAEPEAAAEVVRLCGGLPLAIRIASARLAARPAWPVSVLAARLAEATDRLEELEVGELAVRASFDVSLHALRTSPEPGDQRAAAAFGVLALPDGPDLSLSGAARLLDQPDRTALRLLERLVDAQVLEDNESGRYRFHDLVRLYARQHAATGQPESERLAALSRLFGFYTATAWHALALLRPGDQRLATVDPRWTDSLLHFSDTATALDWLETERANVLAVITQTPSASPTVPPELATQLTRALFWFFETRGYWQDGMLANQTVLELARRTGDRPAQAHAHNDLGAIHAWLGQYPEAIASLQDSLVLFRELGDRHGQAASLTNLGIVYVRLEQYREAMNCLRHSLTLRQELGDRYGQAISLTNLGEVLGRLERYREAMSCLRQSLMLLRELGDRHVQAHCVSILGAVYERLGWHAEALGCLQDSLTLFRELGDRHGQAELLRDLGDTLLRLHDRQGACEAWQEALELYQALRIPEADKVRRRLAALPAGPSSTAN